MLRSRCGTKDFSHFSLARTMWGLVGPEQGATHGGELLSEGDLDPHGKGGLVGAAKRQSTQGTTALVNELIQNSPVGLKIQSKERSRRKTSSTPGPGHRSTSL